MCRSLVREVSSISHLHVKHMIQSRDPENLHQLGANMPDRESSADAVDPFLEADQSTQGRTGNEMNIAQIKDQMNPGFERDRVKKMI